MGLFNVEVGRKEHFLKLPPRFFFFQGTETFGSSRLTLNLEKTQIITKDGKKKKKEKKRMEKPEN